MDVEIQELEEQAVASVVLTITKDAIAAQLGIVLPEVAAHLASVGAEPAGPPFARWWRFEEDDVEMEAGVPVAAGVPAGGRVSPSTLPGGPAAVARHVGPYTKLPSAYRDMEAWAADGGHELGEGPWEVYLTDPGEEPDSSVWETDVWPLAREAGAQST